MSLPSITIPSTAQRSPHARRHEAGADLLYDSSGPIPIASYESQNFPAIRSGLAAQSFPAMIPYSEAEASLPTWPPRDRSTMCGTNGARGRPSMVGRIRWPAPPWRATSSCPSRSREYSALMVMEHRYGAHRMRQYLKYELDTYLRRAARARNERPLAPPPGPALHPLPEGRARDLCPQGRGRRNGQPRAGAARARTRLQDGPLSDRADFSALLRDEVGARAPPARHRPVREDHALGPARRRRRRRCRPMTASGGCALRCGARKLDADAAAGRRGPARSADRHRPVRGRSGKPNFPPMT